VVSRTPEALEQWYEVQHDDQLQAPSPPPPPMTFDGGLLTYLYCLISCIILPSRFGWEK